MLSIRVERRGKVAVLFCTGRIDMGESLTRLREAVLCELGARTMVLDLVQVTAIDAAGLGLLMFLHTRANGRGCELKLCAPSPQIAGLLSLTKLDSVLSVCPPAEITHFRHAPVTSAHEAASTHEHDDADCALCRVS